MQRSIMASIAMAALVVVAVPATAEDIKKDNKAVGTAKAAKPAPVVPPAASGAKPSAATPAAGAPPKSPNPPSPIQSRGAQSQGTVGSLSQRDPRADCQEKTARMPEGQAKMMALQKCMQDAAQMLDAVKKLHDAQSRTQQEMIRNVR